MSHEIYVCINIYGNSRLFDIEEDIAKHIIYDIAYHGEPIYHCGLEDLHSSSANI